MSMSLNKKFSGNGGNEKKRIFTKDARFGWKALLADPNRHIAYNVTLYTHLEDVGLKLGGQDGHVLDNLLKKWDHSNKDNPDYEDAVTRKASRDVWRAYY